jgi:hypothetical protein
VDAAPDALPPGLLSHFPLSDDPSGGGSQDTAGTGDATCSAAQCPTLQLDGPPGQDRCHLFDGDDRLDLPGNPVFDNATAVTISSWARSDDITRGFAATIAKPLGTGSSNSWELEFLSGVPAYTGGTTLQASAAVNNGEWHHLAGTHDGTTKILYVNGVEVDRADNPLSLDNNTVVIGADYNSGSPAAHFTGCLSDIRIYDRALSAAEIAALAAVP